ncbi:MAG: neutral zinc metallopeptidase, partial [Verrucomicrobiota bacterium]
MRWRGRRQSTNIEDRRGQRVPGRGFSGGRAGGGIARLLLGLFMRGSMKMRILMIGVLFLGFMFFKGQMLDILGLSSGVPGQGYQASQQTSAPADEMRAYLATMMADNEQVWSQILPKYRIQYRPAKLVIYTERTQTPGGIADARMGPFYMPKNETIYIDPTFFMELKQKFGATGDFAEAYVVAHEYGHHIQQILGRLTEFHTMRNRVSKTEYNRQSVRVELHADFLAGVFAKHAEATFREFLE